MIPGRRIRESVVVSQEPFRPNVRLIRQVLTEMGLVVAVASSQPSAPDAAEGSAEPPGGHIRGADVLLRVLLDAAGPPVGRPVPVPVRPRARGRETTAGL